MLKKHCDYDVVIGVALPFYTLLAVALGRFPTKTRIIYDSGDPFYGSRNKLAPYWKSIQRSVYKKADFLCVPTEVAIPAYSEYISAEKTRVIPQGIDYTRYRTAEYHKHEIPTFIYAGTLYEDIRNPIPFLNYLIQSEKEFHFCIYTHFTPFCNAELKPIAEASKGRIEIHELIPREECILRLSEADFIINFENSTSFQAPSKLMDYAVAKRPVLSVPQGDFDPAYFLEFLECDYTHQIPIDASQYDRDRVTSEFEELF